jgi:pyruvate-ferredoxin/flavodoxin oxidoreductase
MKGKAAPLHLIMKSVIDNMTFTSQALKQQLVGVSEMLENMQMSRTKPFFDAMEKAMPGSGGLFSVTIDPNKCSGCMECVDVCGSNALEKVRQTKELNTQMHQRFDALAEMPNTPSRFIEQATQPGGQAKRLLLDRDNYYAMSSGHGACRGCGEVTTLRLVTSVNHALQQQRYVAHIKLLENMIEQLQDKLTTMVNDENDSNRFERIQQTIATLDKRLFYFENGPTGKGPSNALIANATGCSSVYASTFPSNPYNDPWVNSLFQDAPALAKGIFEGEVANQISQIKALRSAKLDIEDCYDPQIHDHQLR